jgi:hypothetical protein
MWHLAPPTLACHNTILFVLPLWCGCQKLPSYLCTTNVQSSWTVKYFNPTNELNMKMYCGGTEILWRFLVGKSDNVGTWNRKLVSWRDLFLTKLMSLCLRITIVTNLDFHFNVTKKNICKKIPSFLHNLIDQLPQTLYPYIGLFPFVLLP